MDSWLLLRSVEAGGELNRALYILKSRGMDHSNQIREFLLTNDGLRLLDVYLGPNGVLTGSARMSQEVLQRSIAEAKLLNDELLRDHGQMVRSRVADTSVYKKGPSAPTAGNGKR
jgi:circadian clock protein KaiC